MCQRKVVVRRENIKRTCFFLVARLRFRHAPYIAFSSGRAADSSLGLFYNLVGLCANVGHDGLYSILDGADDGVFPASDTISAKASDSQEAEGEIQSGKAKVDTGYHPAVFLTELLEALEEGELWCWTA